ncbi:MAG: aminopeptidase, partial [Planctomycetaceae bacterium]|nr:aminopeptidase [Planctomycetaceae bacterium]
MRKFNYSVALLFFGLTIMPQVWAADKREAKTEKLVKNISERVRYLASDELEGRGVETEGINKAADYIAQHFEDIGLRVDSYNGSPFQPFQISTDVKLGEPSDNYLTIIGPSGTEEPSVLSELTMGFEFNPLAIGASGTFDAEVVFVGYGIEAEDLNYNEYADVDVKDKVVIVVRKEPQQSNPESVFDGLKSSRHATFQAKVSNAY